MPILGVPINEQINLPKKVRQQIPTDEQIIISIQGSPREWLICTNQELYIIKKGMATGNAFGFGVFRMPYKNITNVSIHFHLLTGYFEVSSGGVQNVKKSAYWSCDSNSPQRASNCITIINRSYLQPFRTACEYINQNINEIHTNVLTPSNTQESNLDKLEKLASLHNRGIITDAEFETKKSELLDKI